MISSTARAAASTMPWPIVAPSPLIGSSSPTVSTPSSIRAGSVVVVDVVDAGTLVVDDVVVVGARQRHREHGRDGEPRRGAVVDRAAAGHRPT